jgi:ferredoxin-type protein NapG
MDADKHVNRRRFFREGLRELLKPLANAAEPLEEVARQLSRMEQILPKDPPPRPTHAPTVTGPAQAWLRPPGALDERSFRDTCSRCGTCVNVCPAQCIKIDSTGAKGHGAPYIDPQVMPCVVCDGLVCMRDCPSGALVPTALGLIDMGTAVVREHLCVRVEGEDCQICVQQCPIGSVAIELRDDRVHVIEDGCTGCGVCENRCPTNPKAIVVIPKSAR